MRYALGTRVRIQVSRVDLDGRKIDFRLVHEGEDKATIVGRAMKDKAGGAAADLPIDERGAGGKRSGKSAGRRSTADSGGRSVSLPVGRRSIADKTAEKSARAPLAGHNPVAKKAAGEAGRKQGKKSRR